MALSSRRSGGGGGVPFFLNVVAPATSNRASVVLRAQPQASFWPRRENRRGGRRHQSRATDGRGGDEVPSFPAAPTHLVRLATREDLQALAAIERACGHYEWGPDALKHELESPLATLLVAEMEEEEEGEGGRRRRTRRSPTEERNGGGGGGGGDDGLDEFGRVRRDRDASKRARLAEG